jgi:GPH family glycoside/pentoside/hexuronide:cation symporter
MSTVTHPSSHPARPADGRIPTRLTAREMLSYGCGAVAFSLCYSVLPQLVYPIFNITLGLSATLVGAALAIGRFWDAISDPLMGSISDNARTRWGRRRPFILLGGLLCAVTFPVFWFVPSGWSDWETFGWLVGCILVYYTATTVYCVPYLSLGYELNPDPVERTRLQTWNAWFVAAIALAVPWMYRGAQAEVFGDTMTGMRWIGTLCGLAFLVFATPVFLGCRERQDAVATQAQGVPFWTGFRQTLSNRPFLLLVLGIVTTLLAVPALLGSLAVYINSYYIFDGDTKKGAAYAAMFSMFYFAMKFVILPFAVKLVARFGKIRLMRWSLWLSMAGAASQFFLYTPSAPWLQFFCVILLSPALTCFWLLVNPMKADCADFDEWKTGHRRSGSYAAIANWMEKLVLTGFLFFSGLLLDWSGFDPALGGNQPPHTTLIWRIAFSAVPVIGYSIALYCLSRYPLTDEKMAVIRAELAARETNPRPIAGS